MRKRVPKLLAVMLCVVPLLLASAFAEPLDAATLGDALPVWSIIPFVGMLLCIAIWPLVNGEFWEKNRKWVVLFWSLLFLIPFAFAYGAGTMTEQLLESVVGDYLTFIVLLFGLFCVAGNICLEGNLRGNPKTNVILLLIGTLLASWIGTTGAAMVMIRPVLRANAWRKHQVQVPIFFIFLVANIGGCLSPIGDPPLLMGFMRGVPFTWELQHLVPILLFNVVILLVIFFIMDNRAYKKDLAEGCVEPQKDPGNKIRLTGAHNIIYLVIIVVAVMLSGVLPKLPAFQDADGNVIGLHIYGSVTLTVPMMIEIGMILAAAYLSFKTTRKSVRESNEFTWDAIQEVAILFIGIFITMIPALLLLRAHGADLGLTEPWQMFWATGALSSFLDNTPTYLVFLTTAGALGATSGVVTTVGTVAVDMLIAISCGAVFMGANTYIGNAPNFMVCNIANARGIKMPSFFGYMKWSVCILIPVFLLDTVVFLL